MYDKPPYQDLETIFGLRSLTSSGPVPIAGTEEYTRITSLWIANIYDYEFYTEGVVVSIIHTYHWSKGTVLIPERRFSDAWFLSSHQPMHALLLPNLHDPVETALRSIDAFPQQTRDKQPCQNIEFKINFRNQYCVGEFGLYAKLGFYYSASQFALQLSILKTLISFVDQYDNAEMRLFTNWCRGFIPSN